MSTSLELPLRSLSVLSPRQAELRAQLQQWLDLSCNRQVPISLLILSRSFALHEGRGLSDGDGGDGVSDAARATKSAEKAIADSISSLEPEIVTEVVLSAATPEERKSREIRELKLES